MSKTTNETIKFSLKCVDDNVSVRATGTPYELINLIYLSMLQDETCASLLISATAVYLEDQKELEHEDN